MAEESKKLLIMNNGMLSIKLAEFLVAFLKFLASKTFKSIYNMYFAHIFAIFLRMHGLWISVRKF